MKQQPCDGLNVWLPLPAGADAASVVQTLAQMGWCVRTGDAFAVESVAPALRITVSTLEPAAATRFASQLGRSLR
jgi:DNA-binding transcriptional MocR family regulator